MAPRISETIKQDHRALEACYNHIVGSTSRDEQIRFQNLFVWELARHAVGEELVVYPAFEKHIEGGASMAQKDREEHQKVYFLLIHHIYQYQTTDSIPSHRSKSN
jgi:hemerythrin superfamily protein